MNGIEVYPFVSEEQLITHADNHKGILVAVNAEKVVKASDRLKQIINSNIGYCDGMGAVKAAQKKGFEKVVRLPGCELWLKIIAAQTTPKKPSYSTSSRRRNPTMYSWRWALRARNISWKRC